MAGMQSAAKEARKRSERRRISVAASTMRRVAVDSVSRVDDLGSRDLFLCADSCVHFRGYLLRFFSVFVFACLVHSLSASLFTFIDVYTGKQCVSCSPTGFRP